MPDEHPSSEDVRAALAAADRPVIVAMSRGKDSLCAWTALLDAGVTCIPVHLDGIPGLRFVDESIDDLEQHFQCHIHRLPHPSLFRQLVNLVDQPPERVGVIEAANIPDFDYDDLWARFRTDQDLDPDTWVAVGVRAADSPQRRLAASSFGPWRHRDPGTNRRGSTWAPDPGKWEVHAVWDWNIATCGAQLARHNLQLPHGCRRKLGGRTVTLPIDYEWFGRSFDGIDERFLRKLRDHNPTDYERVLFWYPLADMTIFRTDMENRYAHTT